MYENLDFGQHLEKSRFWSEFSKKISISVNFYRNLDFGQYFRKIKFSEIW